jgi:serine/threonine protein kinase
VYLVLDLCSGVLSNLLAQSLEKMSENNKKHIIIQLLKGLVHIHSKNIVHRDIKLENIMLQNKNHEPQLIIGDFGLSTPIFEENYLFTSCGTPGFVAPEIVSAKPNEKLYNTNCDVFALGVIFHLLMTGRPLFEGNNLAETY